MTIPPHHHVDARTVGRAGINATTTDLTTVRLVGGMDYPSNVSLPVECSLGKRMSLPGERALPCERDYLSDVRYRGERESTHWVMTSDRLFQ